MRYLRAQGQQPVLLGSSQRSHLALDVAVVNPGLSHPPQFPTVARFTKCDRDSDGDVDMPPTER